MKLFKKIENGESVTKIIPLRKIKITYDMKNSLPRPKKINDKYFFYWKNREFDSVIKVDKNFILVDGYITYLFSKMLGFKKVQVEIISETMLQNLGNKASKVNN